MGPKLETLAAALDLEGARREVEELEEKTGDPNFWNDVAASQKVLQRTKQLKNKLENHERLTAQWEDLTTLVEMAMEEDDGSLLAEVEEGYEAVGVLPLNGDSGRLEPGLVAVLIVQGLDGEAVALGPAGVHTVERASSTSPPAWWSPASRSAVRSRTGRTA